MSADMIEVSDKETAWKKYVAGYKGGTVDATIYADSEDTTQKAVLTAIFEGTEVKCFIGEVGASNAPTDGYAFNALVSSIGETYDTGSAIARSISLQITGEVTPYPSI
jgi:predicted secreted protein